MENMKKIIWSLVLIVAFGASFVAATPEAKEQTIEKIDRHVNFCLANQANLEWFRYSSSFKYLQAMHIAHYKFACDKLAGTFQERHPALEDDLTVEEHQELMGFCRNRYMDLVAVTPAAYKPAAPFAEHRFFEIR